MKGEFEFIAMLYRYGFRKHVLAGCSVYEVWYAPCHEKRGDVCYSGHAGGENRRKFRTALMTFNAAGK